MESAQTRIVHAGDLLASTQRVRDNVILIPLRRKGQVASIRFEPLVIETITLPFKSVIRCLRHAPRSNTLFVIDGTGLVCGYDDEFRQIAWKTNVVERPFDGAYCGDGSLIGLHATPFGPPKVVVLDAHSGVRVGEHAGRGCFGVPFAEDVVIQRGVHPGQFLHLRDGSMEVGFAGVFGVEYKLGSV